MFFKKQKPLTECQLQQVSLSAIYTKQQNAEFYRLSPGLGGRSKYFLVRGWGITDTDSARQAIESLIAEAESGDLQNMVLEESGEDAYWELLEAGVVRSLADMKKLGVKAWDIGRAVFVARMCFERKLLRETDVWEYLAKAYDQAVQSFDSWDGFARSYIIGRALWSEGSRTSDSLGFYNVYKWLCKDPTSPWIKVPLK